MRFQGRSVAAVIDEFRDAGLPFAYSSGLVTDELVVLEEPDATEPYDIVSEILYPHGLAVQTIAGVHLVVRRAEPPPSPDTRRQRTGDDAGEIEMIVVSASRYEISRDISSSRFQLDRKSIQDMPDVGDDPIRVTQRLPGVAASGASARSHFRGGESNEFGIMLNGQWLFDPFHVRDYQSVFSAIDARAISGVEVYTGGFPAPYGDRMSGLVLMETMDLEEPRHTEIGISVFNTSFLTSGNSADRQWLFSARRGNLDLVIDPKFGEPSYYDLFGEFALDVTPDTTLSLNALYASDQVRLVLETDPEELEQASSETRNAQLWLQLQTDWSDTLRSRTTFSVTAYDNLRRATTNDDEKLVSAVNDDRSVDQFGLRQDWTWLPSERHQLQWGVEATFGDADYRYDGSAEYFGLPALYPGQPSSVTRNAVASPRGAGISVYVSDRWRLAPRATLEWGLRWDDQTYTELASDAQVSPRVNFLYAASERTEYRLTWGRYHQSQGIHELQVEDGITRFWPAQRSDHFIAGVRRNLSDEVSLRAELFYKDVSRPRPRFENLFDPLAIVPELQPDRVMLAPSSAVSKGVELTLDAVSGDWTWWASWVWSDASDRIDGGDQPRSWNQPHALQGGVTWSDERWTASLAGTVHSGWPTTDLELVQTGTGPGGEPAYVVLPGPRNALQHAVFASLDLRVSRVFDVRRGSLTAFFEVSNLLNRRNPCCRDWDIDVDEDGTPVLEHSYDYWLPLLPAVGVLWEF